MCRLYNHYFELWRKDATLILCKHVKRNDILIDKMIILTAGTDNQFSRYRPSEDVKRDPAKSRLFFKVSGRASSDPVQQSRFSVCNEQDHYIHVSVSMNYVDILQPLRSENVAFNLTVK
jgi:hypothetical protein